jgi:hypothetical protein
VFGTIVVEQFKRHIFMVSNVFRKSLALQGNVENHDTARLAKDDDTVCMRFECWIINLRTDSQYAILTVIS